MSESDRYLLNYLASRIWRKPNGKLAIRNAELRHTKYIMSLLRTVVEHRLTLVPGRYIPRPREVREPKGRAIA